jgi:hypothetical protein
MARTTRARHLTLAQITTIAKSVAELGFRVRPTWGHVMKAAHDATGRMVSRQSLCEHELIAKAYDAKVDEFRSFQRTGKEPKPPCDDMERQDRNHDRERIAYLEARLAEQDRIIVLHVANAIRFGITQRQLEQPTQKYMKGWTDAAADANKEAGAGRSA